ncbi:MAG: hypothetical protein AAGA57_08090 [Planctomycetota bacterium]
MSARLTWSASIGKFGKGVLLVLMVIAVGRFVVVLGQDLPAEKSAHIIGRAGGGVIGALLYPWLFSFLAFHITRRSRVASLGGLLLGALLFLGSLSLAISASHKLEGQADRGSKVDQAARDIRMDVARHAEAVAAAREGDAVPSDVVALDRRIEIFESALSNARGEGRRVGRVAVESLRGVRAALVRYESALQAVVDAGGLEPAGLLDFAELERREDLYRQFREANQGLRAAQLGLADAFESRLRAAGVSKSSLDAAVLGMRGSQQLEFTSEMRDLDAALVDASLAMFQVMRDEHGYWRVDDQGLVWFEKDEAGRAYDQAMQELDRVSTRQDALLQEFARQQRAEAESMGR